MERKVTIQDIADMVHVSKSSVSRFLNDGYVSKENAQKIKRAIEETGFQTNFFASRLKTKRSRLIGIVLPRMDSMTVGKLLTGVNRTLEESGCQGLILVSELQADRELKNIRSLYQQGVDGIIVDSIALTPAHTALVDELPAPIVFTGQKRAGARYVKVDDARAGEIMGVYIAAKGHRRVVFLGVNACDAAVGIERKQGFSEAMRAHAPGCRVDFVETGFSFDEAYARGAEALGKRPTAVVCATDNIALGMLRYLREREIRVPEEISIAGFGGYDVGAVSYPALTSVAFDYEAVGNLAARGILDLIGGKPFRSALVPPLALIERESVAMREEKGGGLGDERK